MPSSRVPVLAPSPARVPRTRMSRGHREQQILDVAETLFVEAGFAETSIDHIARTAGISRAIVYEHFGTKEGIYLGCVRRARRAFEAATLATTDLSLPLREQFERGCRVYFEMLAQDQGRWELLFARTGLVADALAEELGRERARTLGVVTAMYELHSPGAPHHLVEAAAFAVSGCTEQLGHWWVRHPEATIEQVVELCVELVWPSLETSRVKYSNDSLAG